MPTEYFSDNSETVFAAMPFDSVFEDVYHVAICGAVRSVGFIPIRVDLLKHGQDSVSETYRQIKNCYAVIADLSTAEPNVLLEVGYAHALGKPIVQLCNTVPEDLPFMVRNRDTIFYRTGQTHLLMGEISDYLRHLMGVPFEKSDRT
ncbi:hypothetical protein IWX64_000532 [Arthrobacter sp. CAN_A212]|uniref:nucleoside 2-deoxyribosyltransferase n=1 Tax=Arthrobacter sp. CAN_A212 TaxID=2787719 RepID=UPI0018CA22DA